jgi:hypothetical protein
MYETMLVQMNEYGRIVWWNAVREPYSATTSRSLIGRPSLRCLRQKTFRSSEPERELRTAAMAGGSQDKQDRTGRNRFSSEASHNSEVRNDP